jgi:hypothetical protein
LVPDALSGAFVSWRRLLAPLCGGLVHAASSPNELAPQPQLREPALPEAVTHLFLGHEEIVETDAGWAISTRDLGHAVRLARAVSAGDWAREIEVFLIGGRRYVLNAEVLALAVEPLSSETWDTVRQELQWQMSRAVFDRWWREVQPLGMAIEGAPAPCVVLGAPSADVRAWIESKHMPIVERTLAGVLGQAVGVRVLVYAQPLPEATSLLS